MVSPTLEDRDRCECGKPGRHPYPVGGGWALACPDCKAESVAANEARPAAWAQWERDARGPVLPPIPTVDDILRDPSSSWWLKTAVATALDRDPVDAANEAEVLSRCLGARALQLLLREADSQAGSKS